MLGLGPEKLEQTSEHLVAVESDILQIDAAIGGTAPGARVDRRAKDRDWNRPALRLVRAGPLFRRQFEQAGWTVRQPRTVG